MRKTIFSLSAVLFFLCQVGLAQDGVNRPQIEYGPKIGGGVNQFDAPGSTMGVSAGGFFRYGIIDLLAVQGEVLYDLQGGGRHEYSSAPPIATVEFRNRRIMNHAVSVPISVKLMPVPGDNAVPYLLVGGSADFIIASNERRDLYFTENDAILTNDIENISDDIALFQPSVHFGVGMDFLQTDGRAMGMELRYRRGLTNINEGSEDFADPLRPVYGLLYSSTLSVNFYISLSLF